MLSVGPILCFLHLVELFTSVQNVCENNEEEERDVKKASGTGRD